MDVVKGLEFYCKIFQVIYRRQPDKIILCRDIYQELKSKDVVYPDYYRNGEFLLLNMGVLEIISQNDLSKRERRRIRTSRHFMERPVTFIGDKRIFGGYNICSYNFPISCTA